MSKNHFKQEEKRTDIATTAFLNEVAVKCNEEKSKCSGRVMKGRFDEIVTETRTLRKNTIFGEGIENHVDECVQRGNIVLSTSKGRLESPLVSYED